MDLINPIDIAIKKYENHPSIRIINEKKNIDDFSFSFEYVTIEEFEGIIRKLSISRATRSSDIPTKIIKENSDVFTQLICNKINLCFSTGNFPCDLKRLIYRQGNYANHLT